MSGVYEFLHSLSGVDSVLLFLFISGYSIAHSVVKESKGFYRRRFWRIMPVYWVCILISAIPYWMHGAGRHAPHFGITLMGSLRAFPYHIVPLDAFHAPPVWSNPATWSLGIEVVLYALAPLLRKCPTPPLLAAMIGSAIWYAETRWVDIHHISFVLDTVVKFGWAWLAGFIYYRHSKSTWAQCLPFLAWFELTRYSLFHQPHGLVMCVIFGILFVALRYLPPVNPRAVPVLHWLGDVSYPLYLIHMPIMWIIWLATGTLSCPVYLFSALFAAALIYHIVDLPARATVRRWGRKSAAATV